ncbi:CGNR zinc finger domain-containing protein [Streptomyces sp. NPDC059009]|uniref:CGNR zinc finger domain-containing protein n=1 Tax=Streptomyces sp. NPDC059009 TaxID=3346694 RepID=UPI0036985F81
MSDSSLALDLALTIRHDGNGGVADDLDAPAGLTAWVRERAARLPLSDGPFVADEAVLGVVRELRAAVRALFARAVRPGAPSPADAHRLLPLQDAVDRLNAAAARVPVVPVLHWPEAEGDSDSDPDAEGGSVSVPPLVHEATAAGAPSPDLLAAALARAALAFLAGPDLPRLRACHAPRCVRYFLKEHPRQEWCKPSCGNRARVARHHQRHRGTGDTGGVREGS